MTMAVIGRYRHVTGRANLRLVRDRVLDFTEAKLD